MSAALIEPVADAPATSSLRSIAGHGAWTMLAYAASGGSAFGISIMLARSLGPSTWGRYSYYLWLLRLLPLLIAFGVPNALTKTVAERLARGERGQARRLLEFAIRAHALLIAVGAGAGAIVLWR